MSDGELHKKRKLEEIASAEEEAVAVAPEEQDAAASHMHSTTSSMSPVRSVVHDDNSALVLAKEKEKIMKLLEPFSREQLVEILTSAYVLHFCVCCMVYWIGGCRVHVGGVSGFVCFVVV